MADLLYDKLMQYGESDIYPFHMPGHKRNRDISYIPVNIDITEIEGFDNLHYAKGILKEAGERAASVFGADRTWFLINGSTCGLLAAISAVSQNSGGTLIMARNCHKSVYNAAYLNRMDIKYLYPQKVDFGGSSFGGSIRCEDVRDALENNNDVKAVVVTSPTYDGIVSDIFSIAQVCHENDVPLIVDEAHGAHFVLYEKYCSGIKSALSLGADIVIQSLHKTLPSMTQTALMHLKGELVLESVLDKYSTIYQSSSPSYVMMAGMDSCINFIVNEGEGYFLEYRKNLLEFYEKSRSFNRIKVYINQDCRQNSEKVFAKDISKILIFCGGMKDKYSGKKCDGQWLYNILSDRYHLQLEMAAADYVLALTSLMDNREGFDRLYRALYEIDNNIIKDNDDVIIEEFSMEIPEVVYNISEAENKLSKTVLLKESAGMISAEFVYLYPPGSPIVVPGERISKNIVLQIQQYKAHNFNIEGIIDKNLKSINVLIEE